MRPSRGESGKRRRGQRGFVVNNNAYFVYKLSVIVRTDISWKGRDTLISIIIITTTAVITTRAIGISTSVMVAMRMLRMIMQMRTGRERELMVLGLLIRMLGITRT